MERQQPLTGLIALGHPAQHTPYHRAWSHKCQNSAGLLWDSCLLCAIAKKLLSRSFTCCIWHFDAKPTLWRYRNTLFHYCWVSCSLAFPSYILQQQSVGCGKTWLTKSAEHNLERQNVENWGKVCRGFGREGSSWRSLRQKYELQFVCMPSKQTSLKDWF